MRRCALLFRRMTDAISAALLPGARLSSDDIDADVERSRRPSINSKPQDGEYLSPLPRNMGIVGSVASVMNAVIGTGILALPVAFSGVGFYLGSIVMVVCAMMCFVSLLALGDVVIKVGGTSYGNTMEMAIGGAAGTLISIIVLAFCWGVCVVYSVVISANLTDLLFDQGLITEEIIPGIENRRFWILVSTCVVIIPLCMLPNFDKLKYAAMFATTSMIYLTGVIAGYMFYAASRNELPIWEAGRELVADAGVEDLFTPIGSRDARVTRPLLHPDICCVPLYTVADLFPGCVVGDEDECCAAVDGEVCCTPDVLSSGITPWGGAEGFILDESIFASFSTFLFAFLTHTMIPQVVAELIEPSTPRLAMMMGGVLGGSMSLYLFVGLTGYLMFGTCVCDNISVSFGPNVYVAIGQGFVVTSVCCGYATLAWPCRDAILELSYPVYLKCIGEGAGGKDSGSLAVERKPTLLTKRLVVLAVVLSASTVAWFDPPFGAVISILGAVGGGLCGFVMPSLAYMQVYHKHKSIPRRLFMTLPGWCLILSLVFFVVNTTFVLLDTFFQAEADGGGQNRACVPIGEA